MKIQFLITLKIFKVRAWTKIFLKTIRKLFYAHIHLHHTVLFNFAICLFRDVVQCSTNLLVESYIIDHQIGKEYFHEIFANLQNFGPDFEISDCKNSYKTSANHNETSSISFSCANSSKNNIQAWVGHQRGSI